MNIEPDIVTCAKALSGAYLPISAVIIKEKMFQGVCEYTLDDILPQKVA